MSPVRPRAGRSRAGVAPEAAEVAGEPPYPSLSLSGNFPAQVTLVPRALCTLLMSLGLVEGERRHVLVPYVEIRFSGIRQGDFVPEKEDEQELEELFSRVLPLENALWLLSDMARDIRLACKRLQNVSAGPQAFERTRLEQARDSVARLRREAGLAYDILAELCSEPFSDDPAPVSDGAVDARGTSPASKRSGRVARPRSSRSADAGPGPRVRKRPDA